MRTNVKALYLALGTSLVILAVRTYLTYNGGILTGDEARYFYMALGEDSLVYGSHVPIQITYYVASHIIPIKTVFDCILFGSSMAGFWLCLIYYFLYRISVQLRFSDWSQTLLYLTTPFVVIFTVMNSLYLTEAPSLAFCLAGILCLLRIDRHLFYGLASGACFTVAYLYREPYLIFILANAALLLYMTFKRQTRKPIVLLFILPALLFINIPVQFFMYPIQSIFTTILTQLTPPVITPLILPPTAFTPPTMEFVPKSFYQYPINFQLTDFPSRLVAALTIFMKGLFYGWSGIFAVFLAVAFILMLKDIKLFSAPNQFLLANVIAAYASFALLSYMISPNPYLLTENGAGICTRFSYTTLPAIFSLPYLYERFSKKLVKVGIVLGLVSLLLVAPTFLQVIQSNLSVGTIDRATLDYKSPHYKAYTYLLSLSGKTVIFAQPALRVYLYSSLVPNVTLYRITVTEAEFLELTEGANQVLFYGERWAGYFDSILEFSPFLSQVYNGNTSYKFEVLWDDGEAHLFRLVKKSP